LAALLSAVLTAAVVFVVIRPASVGKTRITGYFQNTNGLFPGDDVRILGVNVGKIDTIEVQPERAKVTFWVDDKYKVPANAKAAILAPSLVTARMIQLVPAYTGGPTMAGGAVIPLDRTAVPVEWDDLRTQLEKFTQYLQPTEPGGVSTFGAFINTAADNLRGQGASIRDTIIKLSQAFSALGDHSTDIFTSVRNVSVLVSALQSSSQLLAELNRNLAAVTGLLANDPGEIDRAVKDLNIAASDVRSFVADNREVVGTATDKLASISNALGASVEDIKQTLHITPTSFSNFINIYQPTQQAFTSALVLTNFDNPIQFICGAIQAASRLNAEQSAKLCVQYLAPIVKNRVYNTLPIGANPFVGQMARPNELTYSEDWLRPEYVPPGGPSGSDSPAAALPAEAPLPPQTPPPESASTPLAAEEPVPPAAPEPVATNPAAGLPGIMVPGAGS
jgi:phospholipid/cholesterol/gamma-HCH transport system substrate-binding protein